MVGEKVALGRAGSTVSTVTVVSAVTPLVLPEASVASAVISLSPSANPVTVKLQSPPAVATTEPWLIVSTKTSTELKVSAVPVTSTESLVEVEPSRGASITGRAGGWGVPEFVSVGVTVKLPVADTVGNGVSVGVQLNVGVLLGVQVHV